MERKSQGSDSPTPTKRSVPVPKDTVTEATGDTGAHKVISRFKGFDPNLDWRNPPQTKEFGWPPVPAEQRHKAFSSSDVKQGHFQFHDNPYWDRPGHTPTEEEMARFEKMKELALLSDLSSGSSWGMIFGAIPALLFVCGYFAGGRSLAIWFVCGGYFITLAIANFGVLPKLASKWLQTEAGKSYKTEELFISSFYYGFAVLGSMLIGLPVMALTAFIMR